MDINLKLEGGFVIARNIKLKLNCISGLMKVYKRTTGNSYRGYADETYSVVQVLCSGQWLQLDFTNKEADEAFDRISTWLTT